MNLRKRKHEHEHEHKRKHKRRFKLHSTEVKNMKEYVDTYQVGPAAPGAIEGLVQAVIPEVVAEASKTANGRNINVETTVKKHGNESIGWVFIVYTEDDPIPFEWVKTNTVVTDAYTNGVYEPIEP